MTALNTSPLYRTFQQPSVCAVTSSFLIIAFSLSNPNFLALNASNPGPTPVSPDQSYQSGKQSHVLLVLLINDQIAALQNQIDQPNLYQTKQQNTYTTTARPTH